VFRPTVAVKELLWCRLSDELLDSTSWEPDCFFLPFDKTEVCEAFTSEIFPETICFGGIVSSALAMNGAARDCHFDPQTAATAVPAVSKRPTF